MHACNIRLCIGCMQQMCKCRVLSWFLYCHHLSCSCQNLCKCVPFLADILRFCQYSRQVLCILNIFRQAQLVMWICYAVHHCMIKVFIYVGNFCSVTTFLDNLEMSVNLTAVRELIRCQGIVGGENLVGENCPLLTSHLELCRCLAGCYIATLIGFFCLLSRLKTFCTYFYSVLVALTKHICLKWITQCG